MAAFLNCAQAQGKLSLFGYKAEVDVVVGKEEFKFYAACDPIYIANGLIQVTRNSTDVARGPLVQVCGILHLM